MPLRFRRSLPRGLQPETPSAEPVIRERLIPARERLGLQPTPVEPGKGPPRPWTHHSPVIPAIASKAGCGRGFAASVSLGRSPTHPS